jgi:POT family proton-dependent oligopeptide transporter
MVGQLYGDDLERRDAGFTIFYIGINLGATIAPFITGYLAERAGWHWGFGAAGVGMTLGLALFAWGSERYLHGIGKRPAAARSNAVGVTDHRDEAVARRIAALLVVFAFVAVFWMGYEQAGSSVNLFTDRHVDRRIGGFETPTAWYQSIQPLAVLVLAPIFAALWGALGRRRREPSTPAKIAIGLAVLATSFVVLAIAGRVADAGGIVAPWWIVLAYIIQVVGEMCVSPVGLSYVTKVAPARFASLLMAAWFLATGVGDKLAGTMAGIAPSMSAWHFFLITAGAAGAAALLIIPVVPWLRRASSS